MYLRLAEFQDIRGDAGDVEVGVAGEPEAAPHLTDAGPCCMEKK
jgi:hypothetical protein